MKGEIFTQFNRPSKAPYLEQYDGISLVEPQGSVPIKQQVERFITSGRLLEAYKRSRFDAVDEKGELTLEDFKPLLPDEDPVVINQVLQDARRRIKDAFEADQEAKRVLQEAKAKERRDAEKAALRAEVIAEFEGKKTNKASE